MPPTPQCPAQRYPPLMRPYLQEFDDSRVPLLRNATHLAAFLEKAQHSNGGGDSGTVAVLLFDRRSLACMAAHALWASAANQRGGGELDVTLARIDLQANPALARRLHAMHTPQARLFLRTGEAHTFEVNQYRQPRELAEYLRRQTEPAWTVVDTPGELLKALGASARTAVFLDRGGLAGAMGGMMTGPPPQAATGGGPAGGGGGGGGAAGTGATAGTGAGAATGTETGAATGAAAGAGTATGTGVAGAGTGKKKSKRTKRKKKAAAGAGAGAGGDEAALDTFQKVARWGRTS
jgi:hypothetical protein